MIMIFLDPVSVPQETRQQPRALHPHSCAQLLARACSSKTSTAPAMCSALPAPIPHPQIGQATCKRTMEVVSELNNCPALLEKLHYFCSKVSEGLTRAGLGGTGQGVQEGTWACTCMHGCALEVKRGGALAEKASGLELTKHAEEVWFGL